MDSMQRHKDGRIETVALRSALIVCNSGLLRNRMRWRLVDVTSPALKIVSRRPSRMAA